MKYINQSAHLNNDDIYQALKKDIVTLKLRPGQMISENEISQKYNVSRTPVKRAFLRLESEKFIEVLPQKGSYITLLDLEYIKETIYMRTVLETTVVRSVIERLYDSDLGMLWDNLARQGKMISSKRVEPEEFYEADNQFHGLLFTFADKQRLWSIIQELRVHYTRFRMLDIVATGRFEELYKDHISIFEAIKNKEQETLGDLLHDHLHKNLIRLADKISQEYKDYFV